MCEGFSWHKSLVIDSIERMGSVSAEELYCVLIASDIPVDAKASEQIVEGKEKVRMKMMMCGGLVQGW